MRYYILLILFTPTLLFSQLESRIGFGVGGLTSTTNIEYNSDGINPDDFDYYEEMWGENFQFSLVYDLALRETVISYFHLRIAPTILSKRFIRSFDDVDNEFNDISTTYLNFPVLLKYYFVDGYGFYLLAGPSVGVMLSSSGEGNRDIYNGDTSDFFKDIEFSLLGGLGFELYLSDRSQIFVQGAYHYGLSDVSASNSNLAQDGSDIDAVTRAISFQVGFSFILNPFEPAGCGMRKRPDTR